MSLYVLTKLAKRLLFLLVLFSAALLFAPALAENNEAAPLPTAIPVPYSNEVIWEMDRGPNRRTNEQKDHMSPIIREKLAALDEQYGNLLSGEDQFYLYCLREFQMNSPNRYSDFYGFDTALDQCKSDDDLRSLLHTDYFGLTYLEPFPAGNIERLAGEMLEALGFGTFRYRAFLSGFRLPPGTSLKTANWDIIASDRFEHGAGVDRLLWLSISAHGTFRSAGFLNSFDLRKLEPLTDGQKVQLLAKANSILEKFGTKNLIVQETRFSDGAFSGIPEEDVGMVWISVIRNTKRWEKNDLVNDESWRYTDMQEPVGFYFMIGLSTGNVYDINALFFESWLEDVFFY